MSQLSYIYIGNGYIIQNKNQRLVLISLLDCLSTKEYVLSSILLNRDNLPPQSLIIYFDDSHAVFAYFFHTGF